MSVTAPDVIPTTEFFPHVGDRDFHLRIKRYPDDGGLNAGETWVQLDEVMITNGHSWMKYVFDHRVEGGHDLACLQEAFYQVRRRLKEDVRSWAQYRYWASLEKGGKRAYYTRHANQWMARIRPSADAWRLAKQIWKEITKL